MFLLLFEPSLTMSQCQVALNGISFPVVNLGIHILVTALVDFQMVVAVCFILKLHDTHMPNVCISMLLCMNVLELGWLMTWLHTAIVFFYCVIITALVYFDGVSKMQNCTVSV